MKPVSEYLPLVQDPAPPSLFIPPGLPLESADSLLPWLKILQDARPASGAEVLDWLKKRSEFNAWLEEDLAWRYIRMTCDTADAEASARYSFFISEIEPRVQVWQNELDKQFLSMPGVRELDFPGAAILLRHTEKDLSIFREENVPLFTQIQTLAQDYAALSGAMSIEWEGAELPLPRAAVKLQSTDRAIRKQVYEKIQSRRFQDSARLQALYSELIALRHQVALNAGFPGFRDYMFVSMGRFDYTQADCFAFHESVEKAVVPLVRRQISRRKQNLKADPLRPWDLAVEENGKPPLKAFSGGADLLARGKEVFQRLHPVLGECLSRMEAMGHFDLESRKGKAPGGYNYPLDQTGFPFIFMNASETLRDMVTLMHEGGHAVHSIVTRFLPLSFFRHTSSEVAELASMSMELFSMDHWDVFFPDPADCLRARKEHLEQVMDTLPWVATIDAFQHWIYENPDHSEEERTREWNALLARFSSPEIDYSGYEKYRDVSWQKQLHLYEVPFYYIEYGMAQLGAIALWREYRKDPDRALAGYMAALSLGHTAGIREVYEAAGIRFDFSAARIQELMDFVGTELEELEKGTA